MNNKIQFFDTNKKIYAQFNMLEYKKFSVKIDNKNFRQCNNEYVMKHGKNIQKPSDDYLNLR